MIRYDLACWFAICAPLFLAFSANAMDRNSKQGFTYLFSAFVCCGLCKLALG
jgi:hypothetical protein